MALVKCRECGGTVSSFAKICPHCGHPMEDVEIAPEVTNQPESQPEMTYQQIKEPVSAPQVQIESEVTPQPTQVLPRIELPLSTIGKVLMCIFSILNIIFFAVLYVRAKSGEHVSEEYLKFVLGYSLSFMALYYLSRIFAKNNIPQKMFGFFLGAAAIFFEVIAFMAFYGHPVTDDMDKAIGIILLIFMLSIIWYAGTQKNWSKYVLLVPGILIWASFALHSGGIGDATANTVIGIIGGVGLFSMLVGWIVEIMLRGNNMVTRVIAIIETLLILTTIICGAIVLNSILDGGADINARYHKLKLAMIFMLVSGASSTLLSLILPRKNFLFYMSVLFLVAAILLTLGHYQDFCIEAQLSAVRYDYYYGYNDGYYSNYYAIRQYFDNQYLNLLLAGMSFIPISILMSYVAEMTKGITSKLSFKIQ